MPVPLKLAIINSYSDYEILVATGVGVEMFVVTTQRHNFRRRHACSATEWDKHLHQQNPKCTQRIGS
jgi:hypothetical protein